MQQSSLERSSLHAGMQDVPCCRSIHLHPEQSQQVMLQRCVQICGRVLMTPCLCRAVGQRAEPTAARNVPTAFTLKFEEANNSEDQKPSRGRFLGGGQEAVSRCVCVVCSFLSDRAPSYQHTVCPPVRVPGDLYILQRPRDGETSLHALARACRTRCETKLSSRRQRHGTETMRTGANAPHR